LCLRLKQHDAWSPVATVAATWSGRTDELGGDSPADNAAAAPVKFIDDVQHVAAGRLQSQLIQKAVDVSRGQDTPATLIHL